jgi:hypothetical protein
MRDCSIQKAGLLFLDQQDINPLACAKLLKMNLIGKN